jgi:hypothetical protein
LVILRFVRKFRPKQFTKIDCRDGFRGIAITGWQRYDHFAVLAELLPVGVPSLAVNLMATTHGFFNESLMAELYKRLECADNHLYDTFVNLETDPFLWDKMAWCFFPGSQLFKLTRNLENVQGSILQNFTSADFAKLYILCLFYKNLDLFG